MPTFTLRLDDKKDSEYIKTLKALMKGFNSKQATETFKKAVLDYSPMIQRIKQLESEALQLSKELQQYKSAVKSYTTASSALYNLDTD